MSAIKETGYYFSEQQAGIDRRTKDLVVRRCIPFFKGPSVLDLGFVDGCWTEQILQLGWSSTIVEGNAEHVARAREHYAARPNVDVRHCLFEEFAPDRRFSTVIAGDILRYIADPVPFLSRVAGWIEPKGRLIVTVPNSRSLHRRIGALLGMERHPEDSNARDHEVGNLRAYDRYRLRHELEAAGLRPIELRGCFLKPLSSAQISGWSDDLLEAFLEIGDELEDYAWFLYAICDV